MNPADAKLDVRDAWGNPIDAQIKIRTEGKGAGKHRVATVEAPGYERERVILDFEGRGELVLLLDPKQCECIAMLPGPKTGIRARRATTDRETIAELLLEAAGKHVGVYDYGLGIVKRAPDRVWWHCKASLPDCLSHSGVWSEDKNRGRGHEYEDGWERIGSWRSATHVVSMQAVVYRHRADDLMGGEGSPGDDPQPGDSQRRVGSRRDSVAPERTVTVQPPDPLMQHVVELDLDMGGFRHLGQVLGNWLLGKETDPARMAQKVAYFWGLRLPFEMRVKGATS